MEYRLLGASGLAVSRLCLGTMTFGDETDQAGSFAQLGAFVEGGGTFLDTADIYSPGVSEQIVGAWLADRGDAREQVVLATKARFQMTPSPNGVGLSRRHLHDALNASLRRLGVESIDLYQLHSWDPLTPVEEYLRFIDHAVSAGKVHYFGLSNFVGWQLSAAAERAASGGWTVPVSLQPQYNLLTRYIELEIVPPCEEYGLGLVPWSPRAGGRLAGKERRGDAPGRHTRLGDNPSRGMEAYDRRNTDATWAVLDVLSEVAQQSGLTMAQAALAWVADRPQVTSPVIGARTLEQPPGSLAVAGGHLGDAAAQRLTEVSAPSLPDYPYGEMGVDQRDRTLP